MSGSSIRVVDMHVNNKLMKSSLSRESGFSLVELMVALVVGLLISYAAFQVFLSVKQSQESVEDLSGRQEAFRFLSEVLFLDLRGVGRNGEVVSISDGYRIEYDPPRVGADYCSSGQALESVSYTLSSGVVSTVIDCEGVAPGAASPIIGGLDSGGLVIDELVSETAFRVTLIFEPISAAETTSSRTFEFHVANKDQILMQNGYVLQ